MRVFYEQDGIRIFNGDCREVLSCLPECSVQTCVTSPPYFGLRDYGHDRQIGLEDTPEAYVAEMVAVFRQVRRVLKDDGTLWLNLGDSYCASGTGRFNGGSGIFAGRDLSGHASASRVDKSKLPGLKPKDLIGIPWAVAFALRSDGWYLRSDIIWHKPAIMPESVTDRPSKSHEYVFLLSKSERYYYDGDAIKEPVADSTVARISQDLDGQMGSLRANGGVRADRPMKCVGDGERRNRRTVWTISPANFSGAHFATFPPKLIEPCIKAGSRPGDVVLDPFYGAGTTGVVAAEWGRQCVGVELNPDYCQIAAGRLSQRLLFGGAA